MLINFWWIVVATCLAWYSTVTIYIAFRGAFDIRNMLARLNDLRIADQADEESKAPQAIER